MESVYPVSYTHLDVYKRQLLDFFHVKQDEVLSLKYIFEQLHLTTHPLKMLCMDIPVSYTHLDVYKRQELYCKDVRHYSWSR